MADEDDKDIESKFHESKCFCNFSSRDPSKFKTWIEENNENHGKSAHGSSCKCGSREHKAKRKLKRTIKNKTPQHTESMSPSKYDWSSSSIKQTHENGNNNQQWAGERDSFNEKEINYNRDSAIQALNGNKSKKKYCDIVDRPVTDKPRTHLCRCSGHKQYKHESFKSDPLQEVLIPCPYREIVKEQVPASKEYVIKEATIIEEVKPKTQKRDSIQKEPERYTSHWMDIDKMENKGIQCMYKHHRRKGYVNHNTIILPGNNATEVISAAMNQGDSGQNYNGSGSLSNEIYKQTEDIRELKKMVATCLVLLEGGSREKKAMSVVEETTDVSSQGKRKKKSSCCSKKKKHSQKSGETTTEESENSKTTDGEHTDESHSDASAKSKKNRKKRPSCFMRICKYCCLTQ